MTNLELTTGEKEQGQESSQYEITFKGGIKEIVSAARKARIVELWENYLVTGTDKAFQFPSGSVTKVSGVVDIKPIAQGAMDEVARVNMSKIHKILQEIPVKDERKKWWLDRIGENIARSKNGESWIYYDKKGNEISKDRAEAIFRRPDAVVVESGRIVEEIYRRPHIV